MTSKSVSNCERGSTQEFKKYQLPHSLKKVGIIIAAGSFIGLFANAFTVNILTVREVVKFGMLIGLLIMSISKEKIEDEFVINLRMQSYAFAFIMGVVLSLFQPFLHYVVDIFLSKEPALEANGDFQILWILLTFQITYFELLKRSA